MSSTVIIWLPHNPKNDGVIYEQRLGLQRNCLSIRKLHNRVYRKFIVSDSSLIVMEKEDAK